MKSGYRFVRWSICSYKGGYKGGRERTTYTDLSFIRPMAYPGKTRTLHLLLKNDKPVILVGRRLESRKQEDLDFFYSLYLLSTGPQ